MIRVPQLPGESIVDESIPVDHRHSHHKPLDHKPVAKAIHSFDATATAKWVPINKSFVTLTKIILRAAAARFALLNIAVTLRCVTQQDYRHLVLVNDDEDIQIAAAGRVEEFIISTEMPMTPVSERINAAEAVSVPINYQQQRLGYIVALVHNAEIPLGEREQNAAGANTRDVTQRLASLADEIIAIIKRYQTRYRAIYVYGDQCYWIGNSVALRELDHSIFSLAKSTLPVLIRGNKGTGKIIAARALHCERHVDMVPFIESDCSEWQPGATYNILQALYVYARGGTLFLRNIDKLSSEGFQSLQQFYFVTPLGAALCDQQDIDLIFSFSELATAVPTLAQWLEQNSNELYLPDLKERSEDLRDLARFFIYEYAVKGYFDFTEAAWQLLESRNWSNNVKELRDIIQKLTPLIEATLNEGALIDAAQLEQLLAH